MCRDGSRPARRSRRRPGLRHRRARHRRIGHRAALRAAPARTARQRRSRISNHLNSLPPKAAAPPPAMCCRATPTVSAKEAARRERRAKALANTKAFGEALAKGDIAAEHADVLADLTAKVSDDVKAGFFDQDGEPAGQGDHVVTGAVRPPLSQRDRPPRARPRDRTQQAATPRHLPVAERATRRHAPHQRPAASRIGRRDLAPPSTKKSPP